ncbi:MAG: cache domain-containing protein, partial [Planctomycetaceae bacterium]|nr:cache domain-containing protein [Planctomycetaceae bacterium]
MKFFRSISAKILVPVIVTTSILITLIVVVSSRNFAQFANEVFTDKIELIGQNLEQNILAQKNIASYQVNGMAENTDLVAAIKEKSREKIKDLLDKFVSQRKCTFFTILDAEGIVIYRTNDPSKFGDPLGNDLRGFNEAKITKNSNVHYETTAAIPLSVRAVAPVLDADGTVIAFVTGGFRLDTNDWVDEIQRLYGVHCTVFVNDKREATTVRKGDTDERATGTVLNNPAIYDKVFGKKESHTGNATVVGRPMKVFYTPYFNEGDNKVMGMFFVGLPIEQQSVVITKNLWSILSISGIALLFFVAILIGIIRAIVIPIRQVTNAATELADGHLNIDLDVHTKDETAILASAFQRLTDS